MCGTRNTFKYKVRDTVWVGFFLGDTFDREYHQKWSCEVFTSAQKYFKKDIPILFKVPFMILNSWKPSLTKTKSSRWKKVCRLKARARTNNIWYVGYTCFPNMTAGYQISQICKYSCIIRRVFMHLSPRHWDDNINFFIWERQMHYKIMEMSLSLTFQVDCMYQGKLVFVKFTVNSMKWWDALIAVVICCTPQLRVTKQYLSRGEPTHRLTNGLLDPLTPYVIYQWTTLGLTLYKASATRFLIS